MPEHNEPDPPILLVEDSLTQAKQLHLILHSLGYAAELCDTAQAAADLLAQRPFQAVLLDLILPDAEGLDTFERVSQAARGVPIIILTALNDRALALAAVKRGAQDFILKGNLEPEALDRALRYAIERQGILTARDQLAAQLAARNAELAHLNEQKNHMLGVIAHDLRNPISVINIYSELLLRRANTLPPASAEYVRGILDSSAFMRRLVDDILDIAKIEAGKLLLNRQPTPLRDLIEANIALHAPIAEEKGVLLALEADADLPLLDIDALKIQQVLGNLLQNAIKFSWPDSRVTLRAFTSPGYLHVEVADRGVGMEPDYLSELFQPFSVPSREGTRGERGSGLGLAIARKIVEGHGGRLTASSTPGEGSTFSMRLPLEA